MRAIPDLETKPFVCSDCKHRGPAAADCSCGGGPLLDLRKQETIDMLLEEDDRRREKQTQNFLWAGVVLGVVTIGAVLWFIPGLIVAIPLPIPFGNPIKFLLIGIGVALLATKALHMVFPPPLRFPELRR